MLSILIPEHNYNCTKLVSDLAGQCIKSGIVFEIIVMDDKSELCKDINQRVSKIPNCFFVESGQNMGPSATRNCLARMAQYPHLLLIDCDAEVNNEKFIERYLKAMGLAPVIVGGINYSSEKPSPDHYLRWVYGRKREFRPARIRNKNPYISLISFNLMIEKEIMMKVPFDERFIDYGHEDSVYGYTLKQNKIKILHIDNTLINGLDSNQTFLAKSRKAVEKCVTNPVFQSDEIVKQIKIFRIFKKIQSLGLCRLLALKYRFAKNIMEHNLCGRHPSLFIYDLYRLSYLCNFYLEQQKTSAQSNTQP